MIDLKNIKEICPLCQITYEAYGYCEQCLYRIDPYTYGKDATVLDISNATFWYFRNDDHIQATSSTHGRELISLFKIRGHRIDLKAFKPIEFIYGNYKDYETNLAMIKDMASKNDGFLNLDLFEKIALL